MTTPRPRSPSAIRTLGVAALVVLAVVPAQALVVTFDGLDAPAADASTPNPVASPYVESGMLLESFGGAFASWGSNQSIGHTGSSALFETAAGASTSLRRVAGGAFDLESLSLSELTNQSAYPAATLTFTGVFADASSTTFTIVIDGVFGNQAVDFADQFDGVIQVSWTQGTDLPHQFDELVIGGVAIGVPEPPLPALLAIGLIALAAGRSRPRHRAL